MALAASQRDPQPDLAQRVGAVDGSLDPILLAIHAPLGVHQRVAMEPGGDPLISGCIRQQVPGQLFNGEPVERQITVESLNDPLAVPPGVGPDPVGFVTVAVAVTGHVQPESPPPLTVMRRGQQPTDDPAVGLRCRICQKRLHQTRLWWQAGQIQMNPPEQRGRISRRGGANILDGQPLEDEAIDAVENLSRPGHVRHFGFGDGPKSPVRLFGTTQFCRRHTAGHRDQDHPVPEPAPSQRSDHSVPQDCSNRSRIGFPSASRHGRPPRSWTSRLGSIPNRQKIVAARSAGVTGRSAG